MKKTLISMVILLLSAFAAKTASADAGDFFFAPEVGWAHIFSDSVKDGVFAGAHFGYDTSDNLTVELIFFYGDNNGKGADPDWRYAVGGGGLSYKFFWGNFKPSFNAGAEVVGLDSSAASPVYKGALHTGMTLEYYVNSIVSVGLSFKYIPVIKAGDITFLGLRLGFEL